MLLLTTEEYFARVDQMAYNMIANNQQHLLKRFVPVVELLKSGDYVLALCLAHVNGWSEDLTKEMRLTFDILEVV